MQNFNITLLVTYFYKPNLRLSSMNGRLNNTQDEESLLGHRLRERRVFLKWSQESLGLAVGLDESCSKTRISRYESGKHEPKLATTKLLANSLEVPLAYFYCEKDSIAQLLLTIDLMPEEKIELITRIAQSIKTT